MKRTVDVHLHGGGLTTGSAAHPSQDGERLAQEGVIVGTVHDRLGSIGLLAGDGLFEGDVMTSNRGFMDDVRPLEWVRDNIAKLWGDPGNVTLMGNLVVARVFARVDRVPNDLQPNTARNIVMARY